MTTGEVATSPLLDAVEGLRVQLARTRLPLEAASARDGRATLRALVDQLDDYVLPRLRRLDAPLLTVVGGSTGAGKSTLVNSIVGHMVTPAGVLRPTTRSPVLIAHPEDERWFADQRILPSLARSAGASGDPGTLHVVLADVLPPGLALLDAPDIDSVVSANRELAAQLLAAADLWLFVTTAMRYADAVPWDLLRTARERSTAVAIVLDRVPPTATDEIATHLARMLEGRGLGDAPLFVVPETSVSDGLLPSEAVAPIRDWLRGLAADAASRQDVVRRTLGGALASLEPRVAAVATVADEQAATAATLRSEVLSAYDVAARTVDQSLSDGSLLRGEVLARWQDFVGTGEILRSLETHVGRLRDRLTAVLQGRPAPGDDLKVALETGVESLVIAEADAAAARAAAAWRAHPAGQALLDRSDTDLAHSSPDLQERTARMVRDWQGYVLDLVRSEGAAKRTSARFLSFGVNGVGLLLMVVAFAHTGGLTGAEVMVAGGASALSQKVLEAVFGDQAVRRLAAAARQRLSREVAGVLNVEVDRYVDLVDAAGVDPEAGTQLRRAVGHVQVAR